MEMNDYVKVGMLIGEKVLAEMAAKPKDEDKLADVVIGLIAVMKPRGVRVTLTFLQSCSHIADYMQAERIDQEKLRPAAALANKKWRAAEAKQETIILPMRRKKAGKAAKVMARSEGEHPSTAATVPDKVPLLETAIPAGDENFVVDVPASLL